MLEEAAKCTVQEYSDRRNRRITRPFSKRRENDMYITDKLTITHGQIDHLSRRFRSLISEGDRR